MVQAVKDGVDLDQVYCRLKKLLNYIQKDSRHNKFSTPL